MKKAIVCGHSSGLGRVLSERLLAEGFEVVGVARSQATSSKNIINIVGDLSTASGVSHAADTIRERFADFSVLIYATGVLSAHNIDHLDYETLDYLFRVNLFAPMILESKLYDLIRANGTDVVNVTSSSLVEYYPKFSEYSSSKAAFAKFTDDLRRSLEDTSARVIELCPGGFASNIYVNMLGEKISRDESKQMDPEDLSYLIMDILKLPKRIEVGRIFINCKS